jgi:prepilin-type N-terminal cleavage/methylation domain-containing protein
MTAVGPRQGFTLIEVVITSAIIALLAAIAIPNYYKARIAQNRSACLENMWKIASAVEQAKTLGTNPVTAKDLFGPDGMIRVAPTCPTTRKPYTVFDPPECPSGVEDHVYGGR